MYLPAAGTCAGRNNIYTCLQFPEWAGRQAGPYTHAPMSERWHELESRTRFEPAEVEPRITERWLASGLFHPEPEGDAQENYSIAIPPPNVTGSLHMGHALNGSIQDVLIRYHRMSGRRTKWILGTDHAGIATQAQVEKALRAEGTSRQELGREEFVRRVWEWREHYGHTIVEQFKRLGASCDYSEERFTLDEGYHRAVVEVFVALYKQGLIYRDRYIVNWDPGSRSAISDLEVEERRETDTLYSIRYDVDGGGSVTIATVRPETMLGDTAVAVHPEDERYRELVGRTVVLPLVGRHLPIVADEYVKRDFGTGLLKVTPAHDPADFEIGQRHELDQVSVIGEDGRLTSEAGERFAGLTVAEARVAVVEALRAEGRVVAEEPYEHEVPYSHRSGERIEPLISLQWFMRMDELAAPRSRRCATAACGSCRRTTAACTSTGWSRSARGASRASCGGGTGCRCTTASPAGTSTSRPSRRSAARFAAAHRARRRTCSTRGSPRRCGRSPRSGGPRRPRPCARSTPPRCSPPRGTSCSCGSRG